LSSYFFILLTNIYEMIFALFCSFHTNH